MAAPDSRRHTLRLAGLGVLSVVALGALLWFGYRALLGSSDADLPVVTAPEGDYKVAPKDPGGLNVDHQDVQIYEALVRGRPGAVPETIGPLPEAPRPVIPAPGARARSGGTRQEDRTHAGAGPAGRQRSRRGPARAAKAPARSGCRRPRTKFPVQLGAFSTRCPPPARHGSPSRNVTATCSAAWMRSSSPARGSCAFVRGRSRRRALAQLVCEQLKARNVDCFIVR